MSSELTVRDYTTGEILDVREAGTEQLAEWTANLYDLRAYLSEMERLVSDTLVERLDAEACWTVRVGDPKDGCQYEIKAASPAAGTEVYLADKLEDELDRLVEDERITEDAATKACKRSITLTLGVPWAADPARLAEEILSAASIQVGEFEVTVLSASANVAPVAAGIKALRKLQGVGEALDRALASDVVPPARRAKVTRKGRAR